LSKECYKIYRDPFDFTLHKPVILTLMDVAHEGSSTQNDFSRPDLNASADAGLALVVLGRSGRSNPDDSIGAYQG
jgi:hypothetical protein